MISQNNSDIKKDEIEEDENLISLSEIADNSSISLQLGYGLIKLVDDENDGPLIARIRKTDFKRIRICRSSSKNQR